MAGIVSGIGVISKIISHVIDNGLTPESALSLAKDNDLRLIKHDGSIMRLLGKYIVEPVFVVSEGLRTEATLDNITGLHGDLFAGMYVQAFNILRSEYGVSSSIAIDALSTDGGGVGVVIERAVSFGLESRKDYIDEMLGGEIAVGCEAMTKREADALNNATKTINDLRKKIDYHEKALKENSKVTPPKIIEKDNKYVASINTSLKELFIPNAIQRSVDITVRTEHKEKNGDTLELAIVLPLTIKGHVLFVNTDTLLDLIESNGEENRLGMQIDAYRSGAKSGWDLFTANSMIAEYKKSRLRDKSGLRGLINSRITSANSKLASNHFVGYEKFYQMYILSNEDKVRVERKLRGKLSTRRFKEKFLEYVYGLSVTTVDQDYERINIGFKDISGDSSISFKTLSKLGGKGGGGDMNEIVKALLVNKPPVFGR